MLRTLAPILLATLISGCGLSERLDLPWSGGAEAPAGAEAEVQRQRYAVRDITVTVPRNLVVSEADAFYPTADIVWRGEAPGDRFEQVENIFIDGFALGALALDKGTPVDVHVEVTRFHAMTERARMRVDGVNSIRFYLTLFDPETGMAIDGPRYVVADVRAPGGLDAIQNDMMGFTERDFIADHLAGVLQRELGVPEPEIAAQSGQE